MPAPPTIHLMFALEDPGPLCGVAGPALYAALHPDLVTCPDCLKAEIDLQASPALVVESGVSTPAPGGDRASTAKGRGKSGVSEKVFRQQVLTAATEAGWKAYFTWTSLHSPAGFPDLVLVKPGYPLLVVELKTEKGKVTKSQRQWLEALAQATAVVSAVWRPRDWPQISRLLAAPDPPP